MSGVLEVLRSIPMSDNTVKYYKSCFNTVAAYCEQREVKSFGYQTADELSCHQQQRYRSGEITLRYFYTLRKAAFMLAEYLETGTLVWRHRVYNQIALRQEFEDTLTGFGLSLSSSLSQRSAASVVRSTRQFFRYLEGKGISQITQVSANDIREFVQREASKHKANMGHLTWPIKRLFTYLNTSGLSSVEPGRWLANVAPPRKKVLPCFTPDEVESILAAVDTNTAIGKRDYAIIKIALGTGLRCIDICGMKLGDIDWRKNEITVVQSKNGKQISLPLMPDVGNAIADYILNARPNSGGQYVFLRHCRPHDRLGNGYVGVAIIKRYQEKAGIGHEAWDGKTFHAFRRTRGTRLVEAHVPLAEIAQILGHSQIDSTKRYIALHDDMLRICCMDIADFATAKEGMN
jgi:site-specific recombinase XerD